MKKTPLILTLLALVFLFLLGLKVSYPARAPEGTREAPVSVIPFFDFSSGATVPPTASATLPSSSPAPYLSVPGSAPPAASGEAGKNGGTGAAAALVADVKSGTVSFERNAAARWPLASLSKLMTAVVTLQQAAPTDVVTIPPAAFFESAVGVDPVPLSVGERYTVRDLLSMMLLPSSNRAADALCAYRGRAQCIAGMNRQAAAWGASDTHFEEPTGLSVSNQSTARDLETLAEALYREYPQIFATTRQLTADVVELNSGAHRTIASINEFAGRADFLGGKTGYTDEAGGNLVSLFLKGGRPVLVIVLGSSDRFAETRKLLEEYGARTGWGG